MIKINYFNRVLIATKFNEFFTNVASSIVQNIHPVPTDHTMETPSNNDNLNPAFSFSLNPLTNTEICEAIDQLKPKNTADFEGISSNFIKKISSSIIRPLFLVFKSSFCTGVVSPQLKIAKIIPLYKNGDTSLLDNYI